jgi:hypothetical protein
MLRVTVTCIWGGLIRNGFQFDKKASVQLDKLKGASQLKECSSNWWLHSSRQVSIGSYFKWRVKSDPVERHDFPSRSLSSTSYALRSLLKTDSGQDSHHTTRRRHTNKTTNVGELTNRTIYHRTTNYWQGLASPVFQPSPEVPWLVETKYKMRLKTVMNWGKQDLLTLKGEVLIRLARTDN